MSIQYPTEREEFNFETERLNKIINQLEHKNRELNIALMRKSAEASEAQETLKRCRLEWEIVADQKGHNLCWRGIAIALKKTIGHTGKYPDPDNISSEQFAHGRVDYHRDIYPDSGTKLVVVKISEDK